MYYSGIPASRHCLKTAIVLSLSFACLNGINPISVGFNANATNSIVDICFQAIISIQRFFVSALSRVYDMGNNWWRQLILHLLHNSQQKDLLQR